MYLQTTLLTRHLQQLLFTLMLRQYFQGRLLKKEFIRLWIRLIHPLLVASKPYEVESVVAESRDTYSLNLKPKGHKGFKFEAGQIAWISVAKSPFSPARTS